MRIASINDEFLLFLYFLCLMLLLSSQLHKNQAITCTKNRLFPNKKFDTVNLTFNSHLIFRSDDIHKKRSR